MKDNKEEKNKKDNPWTKAFDDRKKRFQEQKELSRKNSFQARNTKGNTQKNFTRNRRSTQGGGSTMEILVAFVIITLVLTSVIMVVFGNQSFALDTKVTQRALYHAERGVETAFASSTVDFSSLASTVIPLFGTADDIYGDEVGVDVVDISPCVKRVESSIDWGYQEGNRTRSASLSSIFVSTTTSAALGGDCDTEGLSPGWENPTPASITDPIHNGSKGTDIDVLKYGGRTLALLTSTENGSHGTLWLIDVSDPGNGIDLLGSYTSGDDLNAIDSYYDSDSGYIYAYTASASTTAQLQVVEIDASDLSSPTFTRTSSMQLPGIDPSGSFPGGWSIFYLDEKVYVGTKETGGISPETGDEFQIFDVSMDPAAPFHLGSVELFTNVNDIVVRDNLAYLSTSDNDSELCIIDVSDPSNMDDCEDISGMQYDASGIFDGTSISVSRDNEGKLVAYLGRKSSGSSNDFYILDVSDPTNVSLLGSKNLEISPSGGPTPAEVVGINVNSNIAFIVTSDTTPANGGGPFMVWNVKDPSAMELVSTCPLNYSEKATGFDFRENVGYVSNESNDAIRIIEPSLSCS